MGIESFTENIHQRENGMKDVVSVVAGGGVIWVVVSNLGPILALTAIGGAGLYVMDKILESR